MNKVNEDLVVHMLKFVKTCEDLLACCDVNKDMNQLCASNRDILHRLHAIVKRNAKSSLKRINELSDNFISEYSKYDYENILIDARLDLYRIIDRKFRPTLSDRRILCSKINKWKKQIKTIMLRELNELYAHIRLGYKSFLDDCSTPFPPNFLKSSSFKMEDFTSTMKKIRAYQKCL